MTSFFELQSRRDAFMTSLPSLPIGDECRRWSLCPRCETESDEMRFLTEQLAWEDDHAAWGCTASKAYVEPIDIDLNLWPYPDPNLFDRRLEPLEATIHVHHPTHDGFTSGRTPQTGKKAA